MRNLIIKTALITFAAIILCFSVVYGALVLISPSTLSGIYKNVGANGAAFRYAELAYKKDPTTTRAKNVADCAIELGDGAAIIKYCGRVIADETISSSDRDYYAVNYVSALYKNGEKQTALEAAVKNVGNYGKYNSVRALISEGIQNSDVDFIKTVREKLAEIADNFTDETVKSTIQSDIAMLDNFISSRGGYSNTEKGDAEWSDYY